MFFCFTRYPLSELLCWQSLADQHIRHEDTSRRLARKACVSGQVCRAAEISRPVGSGAWV